MTDVAALTILDFGRANIDLGFVMAPGDMDGKWAICPFPGYLITLKDQRTILVDTGPNRRHIHEPMYEYGDSDFAQHLKPQMTDADDPVRRLAEIGLTIDALDMLILTHTHFDHAGNTADFEGTEIVIHSDAYEFGRERWLQGIPGGIPSEAPDGSALNYQMIEGDVDLADGLKLLETPGHAPGHMSIQLDLDETGTIILAIDAIYSQANRDFQNYQVAFDSDQARSSAERLIALEEQTNGWLIYGHDPAQWAELQTAPDSYR